MKKYYITSIVTFCLINGYAQDNDLSSSYDFWVGNWNLTWEEANGKIGKGTNHIVKILDGKVIQENFEALEGQSKGFKGTSVSVFNPKRKTWHQAWADNQGGYFDFIGQTDGEKKIFKTKMVEKDDQKIIQRMVFYNITATTLTWDWESTKDGGENWTLQWRINYEKMDK